ncbi:YjjG family noncanonical pyrimidine nucleotidase [uncultured Sunxiuqinia sp.]|uniref:YjjG family noncanonical pyrimidine nucleotidase n=1 Tax=uncultured Sunxiuqinia sp. TaxID=1573825 RepID=UPI002AA95AE8|nr:YjjG family noncanonical pyrimidine nucleotidase [uncultured Sunxiuqinia sp.]
MKKYEQLFFDLDRTLWDFDANSKLTLKQTFEELAVNDQVKDFEAFFSYYQGVNHKLWEAYRNKEIRKPDLIKKRFEDTLSHFNVEGIDPVEMNEQYLELMPLQTKLFPGVVETLQYLKERRYQMHIITNGFTEVQHRKISTSGLDVFFDRVFTSEAVKIPKPDKRIFLHALKCCNSKKKTSVMIGDSWETDILGAKAAGIDQVFVSEKRNISEFPLSSKSGSSGLFTKSTRGGYPKTYCIKKIQNLTKLF